MFIVWTINSFFLGNTNHSILFPYILVIVCANLTSNAVIFKRLSRGLQIYTSLLVDVCNDYRPYLSGADPGFFLGGGAPLRNDVTDDEVKNF